MWSLYENKKRLEPLVFSNGKSQDDIVKEVLDAIKEGNKIIFIKGVCGTGKSVIALNIAKELGRASIVVPIKNLQKQYEDDYTEKKYILGGNGQKLKIKVIKGRQNFSCPFLKENSIKEEKNSTLDIFDSPFKKKQPWELPADESCDNPVLPCKIEINKKNEKKIGGYLKMNEKIKNNLPLKSVRRMSIAPVCRHYSPIVSSDISLNLEDARKTQYKGMNNINFTIYSRKSGCEYYEQYLSYINSDVLIFNSHKYKLETLMNRKPCTDVEIIDECDEFLDSFANSGNINLNRLYFALGYLFSDNERVNKEISEITAIADEIINDRNLACDKIIPIKETKLFMLLKKFFESDLMSHVECDEENYCYHADETAKEFADLFNETYVLFEKEEKNIIANIVTINIEKRFKEMLSKNKSFVLMSGTIHNENVLKEIFGLDNFKIIEAETKMPGKISKLKTGMEFNCRHENLSKDGMREKYLLALSKCIEQAKLPALVHVNSFYDLPNRREAERLKLSIMTREELVEMQKDKDVISKFKNRGIGILYSTKCNRGVDFPGEVCNSIIITKYPYPDVKGLFWQLLKKIKPEHYRGFYLDKARREFLQRIYRGLRSEHDHIYLLSPDSRVFEANI
ncbi:DEAD/DEAH box helicase family protein [Candidatus Pacearchaeota archaeon]|nr:DEAD/DEAH box helicase family protein [Candidatus Pacearchaeota archaeon]